MKDLKIRLVRKDEYEQLMELMNISFNFLEEEQKFEHILPKLYFKENKDMIHYGAFVDGKLVASVGLYFMTFVSKYNTLKVGCVGAVSTHPEYRNRGYFTSVISKVIKYAKSHDFDLLFLGGNRFRYNHFGFENAGRKLVTYISQRTKGVLNSVSYDVLKLERNNLSDIKACLKLYNKEPQRVLRNLDNFYDHVISWNSEPYVVKVDGKIIGYYSITNNIRVAEMVFQKKYLDTMLEASLGDREAVCLELPYSLYSSKLLSKVDGYEVKHCEMYNVLNWDNVMKYLAFDNLKIEEFNRLTKVEKVRALLGCEEFSSVFAPISMYISRCDQG
jgi:predicted N-acetyltransferase YhbS